MNTVKLRKELAAELTNHENNGLQETYLLEVKNDKKQSQVSAMAIQNCKLDPTTNIQDCDKCHTFNSVSRAHPTERKDKAGLNNRP